jgi:predicted kinase/predicted phosphodiesterase
MSRLIILSGPPACGKSHFVAQHGLEPFVLSFDSIRMELDGLKLGLDGQFGLRQDNKTVFDLFETRLNEKMLMGQLVVLDNTHTKDNYFTKYAEIAYKYRYQPLVVSFASVPLQTCLEQNNRRPSYKRVPDTVLVDFYNSCQNLNISKKIKVVEYKDFDLQNLAPIQDFNHYQSIFHIGDLQGEFEPLERFFQANPYDEQNLYIFTGDLVDRGTQNHLVVKFVIDLLKKPNVWLIQGNHDTHLYNWSKGQEVQVKTFRLETKPQLEGANINPKEVESTLRKKMLNCIYYKYEDKEVLVTHGGLSAIPRFLAMVDRATCVRGVGKYEDVALVSEAFVRNSQPNQYSIHGHRNPDNLPTQVNSKVYNLEGKIEFAGELRAIKLDIKGFEVINIPSKSQQRLKSSLKQFNVNLQEIQKLQQSPLVTVKNFGNISSYNFNETAFFGKQWDEQSIKARGLFISNITSEIVIRSYNKFFNYEELPETTLPELQKNLQFPLRVWLKENGYLGLMGYDSLSDKLIFASKSTLDSSFALWFEEQVRKLLDADQIQELTHLLKTTNTTLVFEVIEPVLDPHIVEYSTPKIVLLDAIKRQFEFQAMDYAFLETVHKKFGFEIKQLTVDIPDFETLESYLEQWSSLDYTYNGQHIEGFVIQDSNNYHFKIKLPFYIFWKQMRQVLDSYNKNPHKQFNAQKYLDPILAKKFIDSLKTKSAGYFGHIITARKSFESFK